MHRWAGSRGKRVATTVGWWPSDRLAWRWHGPMMMRVYLPIGT
eukprot:SAG22_NODE_130_length_18670_cov_12.091379_8_plen_43_part_00